MLWDSTASGNADTWEGWQWLSRERPRRTDQDFYRSPEWRAIRNAEFAANKRWYGRATPTCERCGAWRPYFWTWKRRKFLFGSITLTLPVRCERKWHGDHIFPRSTHPELELDPNNVQTFCSTCNHVKGNRSTINWKELRRKPFGLGYPKIWMLRRHQRVHLGWSV